jgi:hypothetical protein
LPALSRSEWKWRAVFATVGTLTYWPLFHPDWRNGFLLLYDAPTLWIAWGFVGSLLWRISQGQRRDAAKPLIALLIAVILASGAQYAEWPISGHLTIATTAGVLECANGENPRVLRFAALLPIVLLVLIRTFWPQMPQMDNVGNTVRALCVGLLLSGGVLR